MRIADVGRSDGLTLRTTTQRLSPDGVARSRFLPPGTLIMSIAATVGVPIVTGIPACIHDGFVAIEKLRGVDRTYLLYTLKSLQDELRMAGQTGSQANVNSDIVKELQIPLPPIGEQKMIAAALLDADHLIALHERQIAKKRAIKQGIMQQLLTGKTRLAGFSGDWRPLRIASHSTLKARIGWQGLTVSEYRSTGEYRLVGGTEFSDGLVDWVSTPYVDKWRYDQDAGIQLRSGDVLITKDGTIGKIAIVDALPGPATLNSGVFVVRPLRGAYESRFLYYLLRSRVFEDFLARLTAGSTISHLYQRDLVGLVLEMPPSQEEQRAIADVLWDSDNELTVLRQSLAKARNTRLGMMQQLLSGRTRLKAAEGAA